jgi:hypothetical protein
MQEKNEAEAKIFRTGDNCPFVPLAESAAREVAAPVTILESCEAPRARVTLKLTAFILIFLEVLSACIVPPCFSVL